MIRLDRQGARQGVRPPQEAKEVQGKRKRDQRRSRKSGVRYGKGGGTPINKTEAKKEEQKKKRLEKEKRKLDHEKDSKKSGDWMKLWVIGKETEVLEPTPTNPVSKIRRLKEKLGMAEDLEKDPKETDNKKKVQESINKFEDIERKNRETVRRGLGCNNPKSIRNGKVEPRKKRAEEDEKDDTNGTVKQFWEKKSEQVKLRKKKFEGFGKKKEREGKKDFNGLIQTQPRTIIKNKIARKVDRDDWKDLYSPGTASKTHWELIGGESDGFVGLTDQ